MPQRIIENLQELKSWVGGEGCVSDWREVSQDDITRFADVTGDRQWIHVDGERARRESPCGATVAHGFFTLSLLAPFLQETVSIRDGVRMAVNYGLNRVRFPAPVTAGSRIRARFKLQSLKELDRVWEAVWAIEVEREGRSHSKSAKPCCVAECVVRYYE